MRSDLIKDIETVKDMLAELREEYTNTANTNILAQIKELREELKELECQLDAVASEEVEIKEYEELTAVVKIDGEIKLITDNSYKTKKAFKEDLKMNGYIVKGVYNKNDLLARERGYNNYKHMLDIRG